MNIEQLRQLCLSFPGTSEDVKWGNNLCFMVAEKIFVIAGLDATPTPASFKVSPEDFELLSARERIDKAAYLAKGQWVRTEDTGLLSEKEWQEYARKSYELVKSKLLKKKQEQLLGNK